MRQPPEKNKDTVCTDSTSAAHEGQQITGAQKMEEINTEQEQIKKNVIQRMKRVEGQIRGIQRMIEEGKECEDILVQVRAARSALQSASRLILKRYLLKCHIDSLRNSDDPTEPLDKVIDVLSHYVES
jgi:DNA-binding FrmR family transcriptional regulator